MRPSDRVQRMEDKIVVIWLRYPDQRFGQFVYNLYREYMLKSETYNMNLDIADVIWNVEDEQFEAFLDKMIEMS